MTNSKGWGIPFLGCISLSSGLWAAIILGGGQVTQALNSLQEGKIAKTTETTMTAVTVPIRAEINAGALRR
jgi:hypothetical protein|tara:strand:- start:1755 stop:1967 length:213 start_codon:yes stop_codon:yes gene_type:complete